MGGKRMKSLTDDSIKVFGSAVLLRHLFALEAEIEGVRRGDDIENVHRMRVASRRFRSAFSLFSNCFPGKKARSWNNEIRKITSALGSARDADVQIAHLETIFANLPERNYRSGVRRLLTRLKQQRIDHQIDVLRSLEDFERSGVSSDIAQTLAPWAAIALDPFPFSRQLYLLAYQAIRKSKRKLFIYKPYIHDPQRVEELHAMRVAAKQLRYTLEVFEPIYPGRFSKVISVTKEMQEMLGAVHDADVWIEFLPRFIEDERLRTIQYYHSARPMTRLLPGLVYLEKMHQDERQRLYLEFVQSWDQWTDSLKIWEKLNQIIKRPLSIDDRVYPPAAKGEDVPWTSSKT
jgi:CHAD domain-containing protein